MSQAHKYPVRPAAAELSRTALLVAMLSVSSYIAFPLPFSPVPVSGQTIVINLIALVLTPKQAFKTVAVYLLAGAAGLPVFARGASGLGSFVGPGGGFLFGFLAAAVVISKLRELAGGKGSFKLYMLVTMAGIPVIYLCGAFWMASVTSLSPAKVLSAAVLPFIPGDIFKCAAASLAALALNKALRN